MNEWKNKIRETIACYNKYLECFSSSENYEEIKKALEYEKLPDYCIHF